jgi:hypothetical protein
LGGRLHSSIEEAANEDPHHSPPRWQFLFDSFTGLPLHHYITIVEGSGIK